MVILSSTSHEYSAAVLEEAVVAGNNLIAIFGSLSYAWLRKKKNYYLIFYSA